MGLGLELTLLVSQLGHGRGGGRRELWTTPASCQVNLTLKMSALSAVVVAPRRGQRTGERECGRGDQGWGPGCGAQASTTRQRACCRQEP